MKKTILFLIALSALAVNPVFAAKYAGEFLEIGVGARSVGMGGAVTSVTNDASSFYWNPAGTAYVEGLQLAGMYADLWDGLANYSVAGISLPITGAVFSANWVRLGVPNIQQHQDYDLLMQLPDDQRYVIRNGDTVYYNSVQEYLLATGGAPQGIFSDNESAIFLTFAKLNKTTLDFGWSYFQLPIEIPLGASIKIINQKLGSASASGVGADFGMQIRFKMSDVFYEKWRANFAWGMNVQDASNTALNWGNNNKDAIPPNFRTGVSIAQKLPWKDNNAVLSFDTEKRYGRTNHLGVEYQFGKVLALRGGFWGKEWTAGAGVSVWRATVDYAYLSRELGATHRVSIAFKLR